MENPIFGSLTERTTKLAPKKAIMKKHNFSSGPAMLPPEVVEEAAQAVLDLNGSGLSVLEISHRSAAFTAILEEAVERIRALLGMSDDYAVLFLTGGASSQFYMAPMNLLNERETAAYIDTGYWSVKAIKEARNFGEVMVLASSKDEGYRYIPKGVRTPGRIKYLHLTSNNTIHGTQYHAWPETERPIVADMSSDIFSRPFDMRRFGLIYAGAQKNLGPAGVTLVIVRKDLVGKVNRTIPTMLNYETHIQRSSAFNTPPVYPIYVSLLSLRWLSAHGGVAEMARRSKARAELLYREIDDNPMFAGATVQEDRSLMNATFTLAPGKEGLAEDFLDLARAAGCVGLKGHRSVGGFRASIYNPMPLESVQVLVEVMRDFADKKG